MFDLIHSLISKVKFEKPVILNITNDVTMDFIANGLLCLGASPIMSKAPEESADLLKISSRVVINPGTLTEEFITLSKHVCKMANAIKTPIILDPVGAGASNYRTSSCQALLNEFDIAVIKGNASEIMALAGLKLRSKGVDSLEETRAAIESAEALANQYQLCVVISGETDIIVGKQRVQTIESGSPLMPYVTGTGCLLSAVVAAFDAVSDDAFQAAKAATLFYGVCGEIAARKAATPAAFKSHFLDALFTMPMREDYVTK